MNIENPTLIPWGRESARGRVLDVPEVVALEQRLAAEGTSLLELMTRAGGAVAEAARGMVPAGGSVVVLAGSGNNGGDGWVAARDLADAGYSVTLVTKQAAEELTAEPARTAALRAVSAENGGTPFSLAPNPTPSEIEKLLANTDLVIDAILGTGFAHAQVRAPYDDWIRSANKVRAHGSLRTLAVDCPSGLNAQTGDTAADCVEADATVTMLAVKPGLIAAKGAERVGKLFLAPLGVQ